MKKNLEVQRLLQRCGWGEISSEKIVDDLINGGFVKADFTEPERYVEAAKKWVRNSSTGVFRYAVRWSNASWEKVLGKPISNFDSSNIFWALVILAKEEGVEL